MDSLFCKLPEGEENKYLDISSGFELTVVKVGGGEDGVRGREGTAAEGEDRLFFKLQQKPRPVQIFKKNIFIMELVFLLSQIFSFTVHNPNSCGIVLGYGSLKKLIGWSVLIIQNDQEQTTPCRISGHFYNKSRS